MTTGNFPRTGPASREITRAAPRPTAQVAPFVDALGLDLAVAFLLAFGGADLNLPADPKGHSMVVARIGYDNAKALSDEAHRIPRRVPLANRWLAHVLAWKGHSAASIARQLRVSNVTVRQWLKEGRLA